MKRIISGLLLTLVCLMANATPTVKILFVYTPLALTYYGNSAQVLAQASREVNAFNSALSNSGIGVYGAVASAGIVATPTEYPVTQLGAFKASKDLRIAWSRDISGADLIVVLGAPVAPVGLYYCGWVWEVFSGPKEASAIVGANCVDQKRAVRHEVGHLLGLRHQATGGFNPDGMTTPYTLGHGFQSAPTHTEPLGSAYACFYDLMSTELSSCPNLPGYTPDALNYYSNPSILIPGTLGWIGFPGGNSASPYYANAASVLMTTFPIVATYHNTKTSPGILSERISTIFAILWD